MSIVNKIKRFLCTKKTFCKGLRVFKPSMCYLHPKAHVKIDKFLNFNRQWDDQRMWKNKMVGSLYVAKGAVLEVDAFDVYAGSRITVNSGAKLFMGRGFINYNCIITCFSSITIGQDVVISERVVIRDSDNHRILSTVNDGMGDTGNNAKSNTAPIVIKDHVWIGMNVIILKGVTIGEGAVVAAGSVVNKDVPPHCLVAGVPARVVKSNVVWER